MSVMGKRGLSNEWKKAAYPEDYCFWLDPLRLWDCEERARIKVLMEKVLPNIDTTRRVIVLPSRDGRVRKRR